VTVTGCVRAKALACSYRLKRHVAGVTIFDDFRIGERADVDRHPKLVR